ncbi:MAG: hypothetical protein A2355_07895 [Spirochaetes bacterium RIFOXYB1_FULL_32_8]|nr:MAG: hypothetical protein A2Y30_01375 [Spirochaetes bacterium GWE1_32_154]OHD82617.1 MAG: hypothetical protein A2355_07895 [Spirochaetes bacterium RIFOXYB1_FULL_32_8]
MTKLHIKFRNPKKDEEIELAEIRARAMKDSLINTGRFDENRVRKRLLDTYDDKNTVIIEFKSTVIGFYSIQENIEEYYLNHLYIDLPYQNKGFGKIILDYIKEKYNQKDIKLNALKGSLANNFYIKNCFIKIMEDDFDNYYVYKNKCLLVE